MTKVPPAARISKVFPPSVLSSKTPPSKPRLGSSPDASRLKLCRKVNDKGAGGRKMDIESSSLSLTTAGSSINAALGSVSAGRIGTPEADVTHNDGGPLGIRCYPVGWQSRRSDIVKMLPQLHRLRTGKGRARRIRWWSGNSDRGVHPGPNQQHCSEGRACRTACKRERKLPHSRLSEYRKCCDTTPAERTTAAPLRRRYAAPPSTCR